MTGLSPKAYYQRPMNRPITTGGSCDEPEISNLYGSVTFRFETVESNQDDVRSNDGKDDHGSWLPRGLGPVWRKHTESVEALRYRRLGRFSRSDACVRGLPLF